MQDNDLKHTSRHAKLFIEQKGIKRLQEVISEVAVQTEFALRVILYSSPKCGYLAIP